MCLHWACDFTCLFTHKNSASFKEFCFNKVHILHGIECQSVITSVLHLYLICNSSQRSVLKNISLVWMAIKLRICSHCSRFILPCAVDRGIGPFCVAIIVYCMQFKNVTCALIDEWVTVIQCLQLIVQWVFKFFMSFLLWIIVTLSLCE